MLREQRSEASPATRLKSGMNMPMLGRFAQLMCACLTVRRLRRRGWWKGIRCACFPPSATLNASTASIALPCCSSAMHGASRSGILPARHVRERIRLLPTGQSCELHQRGIRIRQGSMQQQQHRIGHGLLFCIARHAPGQCCNYPCCNGPAVAAWSCPLWPARPRSAHSWTTNG